VWLKLHNKLADNGGELHTALVNARATAGVHDKVSNLRALDVVLWRRHVNEHRRDKSTACPQRASLAL
jgi:hypothetical protein